MGIKNERKERHHLSFLDFISPFKIKSDIPDNLEE